MNNKKLNIIDTSSKPSLPNAKNGWRSEAQAHFERLWLIDPEQFDTKRNCMERLRIERTWDLALEFVSPKDKLTADLACGYGAISELLKNAGAKVHALDISVISLRKLRERVPNIDQTYQQCLPHTTLDDDAYDLIFADEVVAYLPSQQLRLFMAELCRLINPKGFVVCSTALDFNTQDPLIRFSGLAETEFKIHKWALSHHLLYIRIKTFFEAPGKYAKAYNDASVKQLALQERKGFSQKWFDWNSQGFLGFIWSGVRYLTNPFANFLNQNTAVMLGLEKICRLLWGDNGISNAIFIGTRRPLQPLNLPKDDIQTVRKGKREVWE